MDSLPPETLYQICSCIKESRTLKVFRLVNRRVNGVAERRLWDTRALVIHLNLGSAMEKLEDLKNIGLWETSKYVQTLKIQALVPRRKNNDKQNVYRHRRPLTSSERNKVEEAKKKLTEVFPAMISSLPHLHSLYWEIDSEDRGFLFYNNAMQRAVHDAFSHLAQLRNLVLSVPDSLGPEVPLMPLYGFTHLESLTIRGSWKLDDHTIQTNLFPMIRNNPNLTSFRLGIKYQSLQFHHLLPDYREAGPQLQQLQLEGVKLNVTPAVIPYIRHLRSLELPWAKNTEVDIWPVLAREGIQLREIAVHEITSQLLDYIDSICGLEVLVIKCYSDDGLASRLYDDSLPKHRSTLHRIEIIVWDECPLAISLRNCDVFRQYEQLVSLSVSILAEDIHPGEGAERDIVASLINNLTHLRKLELIKLTGPVTPGPFKAFDPKAPIELEGARRRAVESVERFRISKNRLPSPHEVPHFIVSTLTPNGHYLVECEEENMLMFLRDDSNDGDDSFHYCDLDDKGWRWDQTDSESDG
ncbi:hypothetical protein V5O48_007030 [Marasmius crinis-equi]|uniref:F-box domain-containing protein n=1 Tax=Marasmius crinis-equi TaxID=585013 RepID=A0ABR3FHU8_9AGAR